jgi:PD-(D/E)XK endonuclease
MSLGFVVAKPYGNIHRYDFIVEGGQKLWRVQVKACASMLRGLYNVCTRCSNHSRALAYKESELDFVVAYIMPEESWFVLPVREVVRHSSVLLRPMFPEGVRRDPFAQYREAWHLLGEPDGPSL